MLPSRITGGQTSNMRKSKLDGKPSLLPKPRRPGSTDRLSTEARRPSTTGGHRSSSAEPRPTFGGARLSREASATKLPTNRSRSQQGERFTQSAVTPLRSSRYTSRPTTTPIRTPSADRMNRSWQTSLERALAFVTVKDQRPISNVAWQRSECTRVSEALSQRGGGAGGMGGAAGGMGGMTLMRPLTIARFVEITGGLLAPLTRDAKLNTDNYVTKLPHVSKRLLYPGTLSKSWLKTVNTLHAFPHALALIGYLLDLVTYVETPISDEELYRDKSEVARLRRDYLYKCWIRFQEPVYQFEDVTQEYLQELTIVLGNDDNKILELQQIIDELGARLEDEAELAARAGEARRRAGHAALQAALRELRAAAARARAAARDEQRLHQEYCAALRALDADIEHATVENQQLKLELEEQSMSVAERAHLLDEVDYALRVQDSKRDLAEQISKMVLSKETELALWQKKTLDCCMQYKKGLIHLSAQFPDLAALAIDENSLMETECVQSVNMAVSSLRECSSMLAERRAEHARLKASLARKQNALVEETCAKIKEIKASIQSEQDSLEAEVKKEAEDAAAWARDLKEIRARLEELQNHQKEYSKVDKELKYWEQEDESWRTKLSTIRDFIETKRKESEQVLETARTKRIQLVQDTITKLKQKLDQVS